MLLSALGFVRYAVLTPVGGCPRCRGPVAGDNCLLGCGWDGPTHIATPGEWVGRPVQTSKHTRMPGSDVRERAAG